MIELMLGAMAVAGMLMTVPQALADAAATRRASKAGAWDFLDRDRNRREARRVARAEARRAAWAAVRAHRSREAGGDGSYEPGARAYLSDVYRGWWQDRMDRRRARRAAREPYEYNPDAPGVRERVTGFADRMDAAVIDRAARLRRSPAVRRVVEHPITRKLVDPVGGSNDRERPVQEETPAPADTPAPGEATPGSGPMCDQCGKAPVYSDDCCEDCVRANLADDVRPGSLLVQPRNAIGNELFGDNYPHPDRQLWSPDTTDQTTDSEPVNHASPEGEQMTAPTGEAVNYETTIAELEALAEVQRGHVDQTAAALTAVADAKAAISAAQESYRPAAEAAASVHDHLAGMSLDSDTLAHTGTITDAMPPNVVDTMFDELEAMEVAAQEQHRNAEVALASTEAALSTVTAKYGDAHATVAGELGGDSRFLDSAGTSTPVAA